MRKILGNDNKVYYENLIYIHREYEEHKPITKISKFKINFINIVRSIIRNF